MKRIRVFILLMIFIASGFANSPAKAAQDRWEVVTPAGFSGTVNDMVSFGEYVYLGTTQGVYKSIDRGGNWTQVNTGLANIDVKAVTIAWVFDADAGAYIASSDAAIYVATPDGVFKSTLGTASWSGANTGLTQTDIIDLKIDQYKSMALPVINGGVGDASSLYAVAASTGSIYRSDNATDSWSLQNTGISTEQIKSIITEPSGDFSSGNIFAITNSNKVYSSSLFSVDETTDESWAQIYSSSSDSLNGMAVLNPVPGSEFLATSGGILRSDNAGIDWISKNVGVSDMRMNSIASDYLDSTILYAGGYDGVYKSINGDADATWTKANLGIGSINVKKVNTNPIDSTLVYAMTSGSIYRLVLSDSSIIPVTNDFTAPAQIDVFSATNPAVSSVTLNWIAPGDDDAVGTASTYDIRYATSLINEGNWAQATQLSGEPAPSAAGTQQSVTVNNLTSNTEYYFAIKSLDEVPNTSILSVVAGVHTLVPDAIFPASPSGLSVL